MKILLKLGRGRFLERVFDAIIEELELLTADTSVR